MEYYPLNFFGLKRKLPIVSLSPKIKIASVSFLGDTELTKKSCEELAKKLRHFQFDYLVGPEVKVVPLLYALSHKFKKSRYIVCRKSIKAYMISPKVLRIPEESKRSTLVLDGADAELIRGKKVAVIDDVVSSGKTLINLKKLLSQSGAKISVIATVFKQGEQYQGDLVYLATLPVFKSK